MSSWIIEGRNGIYLPQIGWWLDAPRPVDRALVSHAHSDHIARHREIVCTPATAKFLIERIPGERSLRTPAFGESVPIAPRCTATLLPAGHIFGSAMILLQHEDHGRLLYSGDFKLRPGLVAEVCTPEPADTLIMETTFGLPRYVFPPATSIRRDLIRFCTESLASGNTPVLQAYSLGKTQEVLQSLSGADLPVMLHTQSRKITRLHEELGVAFPPYQPFDPLELAGHVVIAPPLPNVSTFMQQILKPRTALVSGWALDANAIYRYRCDAAIPLSDHADFPDLLHFVELVQPTRVYTTHGFAVEFAQTLRSRGWEALALGRPNQLELDFGSGAD